MPATEIARRAEHGVAVLLEIYAHFIDGQADAANKRITDALGVQEPRPGPSLATREMTTERRHPEVPAQRQETGWTVGVTAPTGPVRGFSRPRPWTRPRAHGRIADGRSPGVILERYMCWSAAWTSGRSDGL